MLSFWEKNSFLQYDIIIIGGGILGMSAACSIKEKFPYKEILILERGILPTGASTKNAGLACFGSLTEILADIRTKGEDETLDLVRKRVKGIAMLRERLGDDKIGYQNNGGYELIDEKYISCIDEIDSINLMLKNIVGEKVFAVRNDLINEFGFNKDFVKALVYSPFESQIDTGKMMRNLIKYVQSLGVMIITGCEAKEINEANNKVSVNCIHNVLGEEINFQSDKVIVCANAFTRKILPDIKVKPARGQVIVTEPIRELKLKGVFHYDEGFYYFRDYNSRIIFGGGRNLDFETEETENFLYNKDIVSRLSNFLSDVILLDVDNKVEYTWTGIMGFTDDKLPLVKKVNNNLAAAISCNGMGIALSSYVAEELVREVNL